MWTTSMYCALKGFCSREHSSQRHTNSFFSPWMWSLLMCCGDVAESSWSIPSRQIEKQLMCSVSIYCHPGGKDFGSISRTTRVVSDGNVCYGCFFFLFFYDESTGAIKVICFFSLSVFFSRKGNFSFYFPRCSQEVIKEVCCDTSCLMPSHPDSPVYHRLSLRKWPHGRKNNNKNNNKHPHRKDFVSCEDPQWRPDPLTWPFGSILVDGVGTSLFSAVNSQESGGGA